MKKYFCILGNNESWDVSLIGPFECLEDAQAKLEREAHADADRLRVDRDDPEAFELEDDHYFVCDGSFTSYGVIKSPQEIS